MVVVARRSLRSDTGSRGQVFQDAEKRRRRTGILYSQTTTAERDKAESQAIRGVYVAQAGSNGDVCGSPRPGGAAPLHAGCLVGPDQSLSAASTIVPRSNGCAERARAPIWSRDQLRAAGASGIRQYSRRIPSGSRTRQLRVAPSTENLRIASTGGCSTPSFRKRKSGPSCAIRRHRSPTSKWISTKAECPP